MTEPPSQERINDLSNRLEALNENDVSFDSVDLSQEMDELMDDHSDNIPQTEQRFGRATRAYWDPVNQQFVPSTPRLVSSPNQSTQPQPKQDKEQKEEEQEIVINL